MTSSRAYLDYNATAPLRPEARAAILAALDSVGNPSSVHAEGRAARALIETARADIARLVGASPVDVTFTSGGSEAISAVVANGYDAIILAGIEHAAVHQAAAAARGRVVALGVGRDGIVPVAALDRALDEAGPQARRVLVALQAANNETGIIQPVAALAAQAKARGADVLCDGVQAAGRIGLDMQALGVDALALSAHKLGGPKGVGAIITVPGYALSPLVHGGGQERGRRGGTENVAGITGFGAAARAAKPEHGSIDRLAVLRDQLEAGLLEITPEAVVIGRDAPRLANTSLFALPGRNGETLLIALDLDGVAASAGAACSSGKAKRSPVLDAMGIDADLAKGAVRFSLGWATTQQDIARCLSAWQRVTHTRGRVREVA